MDDPTSSTSSADPNADPRYDHWRRNLYVLSTGIFLSTLGFTMSWPFLPLIVRDLGVNTNLEAWVGYLVGSFFVTSFLLTPVWGGLADHFGKRTMVLRAGFGMSAGFVLLPFLPSVGWFLPVFLLIGVANGYTPASMALIASNTPNAHLGRALSMAQMAGMLGTTVGPAAGSVLMLSLPRYIDLFWASGALILVGGIIALLLVKEHPVTPVGRYRVTVVDDLRTVLRIPILPPLLFTMFIFSMCFFGSTTVVSLFTLELMPQGRPHLGIAMEAWVGLATVALTVASSLAVPFWGRLVDRYSPSGVLSAALALAFAASLLFPIVQDPLQLTLARLALGALAIGTQPAMMRLLKSAAPPGMDARVLAFGTACAMLGNGGGPMLAGAMAPWVGLRIFFLAIALLLLASLAWWWWRGMRPSGAPVLS